MKYIFLFVVVSALGLGSYLATADHSSVKGIRETEKEKNVLVNFLDIGQGDATYIQFEDGEDMLIDCAIDGRILEALGRVMSWKDTIIDYLVVTHPDLDHYGGCEEVIKRFDIKHILYNGLQKKGSKMFESFWFSTHELDGAYRELTEPETLHIASTTVEFLYPDHSIAHDAKIPGLQKDTGSNDTSIVTKLTHGTTSVLLMGDAEEPLEKYLIQTYGNELDVDILKLGHHGSDSSSSQEFLEEVSPHDAIASCGVHNKYGHPSLRVLKRLERVSSTLWRTDEDGDITARIGEKGYEITKAK